MGGVGCGNNVHVTSRSSQVEDSWTLCSAFRGGWVGWGEVAFPFKGALETYTNTCGQEVAAALSFYTTWFAASLEPCGVRMKDMN